MSALWWIFTNPAFISCCIVIWQMQRRICWSGGSSACGCYGCAIAALRAQRRRERNERRVQKRLQRDFPRARLR